MTQALRTGIKRLIPRILLVRELAPHTGNRLLLTFDDGPDPSVTPLVLDRLARFNARAMFFIVGRRGEAEPDVLRRIRDEGHILANHTFTHNNDGDPPFREYRRDVVHCQDIIREHTGEAPTWFRPPKGHLTATSLIVPRLLGLRTMNWTLGVRDWACRSTEEATAAAERLLEKVDSGQIIVLHDDNRFILDLLDFALPRLQTRGFDLAGAVETL